MDRLRFQLHLSRVAQVEVMLRWNPLNRLVDQFNQVRIFRDGWDGRLRICYCGQFLRNKLLDAKLGGAMLMSFQCYGYECVSKIMSRGWINPANIEYRQRLMQELIARPIIAIAGGVHRSSQHLGVVTDFGGWLRGSPSRGPNGCCKRGSRDWPFG